MEKSTGTLFNTRKPLLLRIMFFALLGYALLVFAFLFTVDIHNMETRVAVSVALECLGALFATVLYFTCCFIFKHLDKSEFYLSALLFLNAVEFLNDVFQTSLASRGTFRMFAVFINTFYCLVGVLLNLFAFGYIVVETEAQGRAKDLICRYAGVFSVAVMLIICMNVKVGFFFTYDETGRVVTNGAGSYTYLLLPLIIMIFDCYFISICKCRKKKKLVLYSYVAIFVASVVFQVFVFDISFIYIGTLCSFLLMYLYIEVKMSNDKLEREIRLSQKEKEVAEMNNALTQQRILLMTSRMQPHFLYNGLVSIRRLIKKDQDKAVDAIDHFCGYLRGNLDMLNETGLVPIKKELRFLEDYLEIEKVRFGENISYSLIINEDNFLVPPLSIQPLVENSIRHGIRKRPDGCGRINIETGRNESEYFVEVKDDGVGFDITKPFSSERDHVGIKNTIFRVESMTGGRVVVHSKEGKGTTIRIYVPMGDCDEDSGNR